MLAYSDNSVGEEDQGQPEQGEHGWEYDCKDSESCSVGDALSEIVVLHQSSLLVMLLEEFHHFCA